MASLTHETSGFGAGASLVAQRLCKTMALSPAGQPSMKNVFY